MEIGSLISLAGVTYTINSAVKQINFGCTKTVRTLSFGIGPSGGMYGLIQCKNLRRSALVSKTVITGKTAQESPYSSL